MADRKPLSDVDLTGILSQQIRMAKSHDRAQRAPSRARAIEYFLGEMKDTPSEPNRSSVVSRDVADTVGWLLPGIMRVYTASDQMANVEPHLPTDQIQSMAPEQVTALIQQAQEYASQATDAVNQAFWKDNDGYRIVYDATWDALVVGNGIVKVYWDATPQYKTTLHRGLIQEHVDLLTDPDAGAEGSEQPDAEMPEVIAGPTETGNTVPHPVTGEDAPTYDVKTRSQIAKGRLVIDCLAPEDFLIDGDAVTTEKARFASHREAMTRSDLLAMGYDLDEVNAIPRKSKLDTKEDVARDENDGGQAPDLSMDIVDYYECFARLDVDGDGEAELIRACLAGPDGAKLLDWELWEDDSPFDDIPCEPIPHRWDARSIADETMDVQRIKSVLLRQALDNTYASTNPQRQVQEGTVVNMDELFTPSFGGVIITKKGASVEPLEVPFVANHAYDAINYQDQVIQRRTGVSRQTMALDPEALQNQSATANQNEKDASYSQVELLARNMAELGWKKVFAKILRLLIKHKADPQTILVKGKPRQITPAQWAPEMPVNINVGLGTGSRDRDAAMLTTVLGMQTQMMDRLAAGGFPDKALEMASYIHTTVTKFAESTGLKNPELYFPPVSTTDIEAGKQRLAQQAQQGDPKLQLEQQKIQASTASDQAHAQIAQMKAQSDIQIQQSEAQANQQRVQAETQKAQAELQIKTLEFQMAQQKAQFDNELASARLQIERDKVDLARAALAEKADTADKKMAIGVMTEREKMAMSGIITLEAAEISAKSATDAKPVEVDLEREAGLKVEQPADEPVTDAMPSEEQPTDGPPAVAKGSDVADALNRVADMVGALHASINAPTEIVRGPDGKAIGARKVTPAVSS